MALRRHGFPVLSGTWNIIIEAEKNMAKTWLVLKYLLSIFLLIIIVLMGIEWYMRNTQVAVRKNSAFIQSLDKAEQANGDVLKILIEGVEKVNDDDAKLVTAWLKEHENRGDQPYLYFLGIYSGVQKSEIKKLVGLTYIARAALVYRVDAAKCGDPTANQAIPIFESALGVGILRNNLKNNPELRKKIVQQALIYEEQRNLRSHPQWICTHGMENGSPPPAEKEWQAHRQKTRQQFESSF